MKDVFERRRREVEVRQQLGLVDEDNFIAHGDDMTWLISQLVAWPTRVDADKTTNLSFLMQSAALTLQANRGE